jgi:hypothetical protein
LNVPAKSSRQPHPRIEPAPRQSVGFLTTQLYHYRRTRPQKHAIFDEKQGIPTFQIGISSCELVKSDSDLVNSKFQLVKSETELVISFFQIVNSKTELVISDAKLVKSKTEIVISGVELVKSETGLVMSLTELAI